MRLFIAGALFCILALTTCLQATEKRALVAGGSGFLGSHLCEKLLLQGYKVTCVDSLITGSLDNISHLMSSQNFKFVKADVIDFLMFDEHFDEIYNLACAASPPKYQIDPIHTLKTNFLGTLNLLELAKKNGAIFFQASTSEVYGDPHEHPQKETYWGNVNPIGIRACYDEGKRVAETLCFEYHRNHNITIKVARIFNTYGPRMALDDGRVVSNFIQQALQGDLITIYGDGKQTRSFCYVDDLIEGFIQLVNTSSLVTGPVNLGNSNEMTVLDLAEMVVAKTNSASKITFHPLPQDDPSRRNPNISIANQLINWHPRVSLETGMEKTVKYFEQKAS